ncbi:LORF2 protein, partial [Crocuta crocuta]
KCQKLQPLEYSWCFLTKLNILISYNPAVTFLDIYPKELKPYVHAKKPVHGSSQPFAFVLTNLEVPKMFFTGEWINKLWYIQSMEYYSVLKRNELSSHEKTRGNLRCILLGEISPSERAINCMISTI